MTGNDDHLFRMLGPFQVSHYIEGADFFGSLRSQNQMHAHFPLRREMSNQVSVFAGHGTGWNVGSAASSRMRQTIVGASD